MKKKKITRPFFICYQKALYSLRPLIEKRYWQNRSLKYKKLFLHRFIFAFESLNSFPDSLLMIIFVVWITTSISHQDYMTLMFFFNKKGLLYGFTFIFITKEITSSSILFSLGQTPDKILLDSPDLFYQQCLSALPWCLVINCAMRLLFGLLLHRFKSVYTLRILV